MTKHSQDSLNFLEARAKELFPVSPSTEVYAALIQHCIYPRLMHSPRDALYSFHFIKTLHKLRVPNFSILAFIGESLKCLMPAIHFCTEEQAENLGLFFRELITMLDHWSILENWEEEKCNEHPSFMTSYQTSITYNDFSKNIVPSIHKRISAILNSCIRSSKS